MRRLLLLLVALGCSDAEAIRRITRGAQYVYDFTDGVPSTVTCARASGSVWPMQSPSSTSANTAGATCVYENRSGTSNDGGIWTWPAWDNVLTTPNDFTTGWTIIGGGVVTNNAVVSPDGTSNAASHNKNQGTQPFANSRNITEDKPFAIQIWEKNDTTPTDPGMIYYNGTGGADDACLNISNPPPATWTRVMRWFGTQADTTPSTLTPFAVAPAGLQCGPTFTNTATGIVDFWGAQVVTGIDYPLGAGAIAAQTLELNSDQMDRLVTLGDFEIDVFARIWTQQPRSQPAGCIFGGTSADGGISVCYTPNINAANAATWTFTVAGATVLTTQMGLPLYGSEVRVRAACRPSTNTSVLRISIMGTTEYAYIATGTCNGGTPLATPSSFFLGSNNGSASYWPAMITRLVSYTRPQAYNRDQIVWLGDSISSWTPDTDAGGARLDDVAITAGCGGLASAKGGGSAIGTQGGGGIYTLEQSRNLVTHPGIAAVVSPGATCEDIETNYVTTPFFGSGFTKAVIIECGTNNINPAGGNQSAATAAGHYQSLVTAAATANPSAAIICAQITPWAAQAAKVSELNDDIAGTGPNPISGCDYVVTASFDNLNNAGACSNCTDGIHPTNIGKQLMTAGSGAGTYVGSLTSAGVLP